MIVVIVSTNPGRLMTMVLCLAMMNVVDSFGGMMLNPPSSSTPGAASSTFGFQRRRHSQEGIVGSSSSSMLHCICVNCKWVTSCSAYHFVETKHEQPHMTENPTFEPRNGSPTIHVNIRTHETMESQRENQRLWKEHEEETRRAQERADAKTSTNDDVVSSTPPQLHGQERYNLHPKVTMEYDVVKCEDFVQDMGCWVRNMPEEIRKANPNFVPS